MSLGNALVGNLMAGVLGRAVSSLLPIVVTPLMIGHWGMSVYGEWLVIAAIPAYFMVSPDFGLAGAVVNEMARLTASGRRQRAILVYRTSWIVLVCAAAAFCVIGTTFAWFVDWSVLGISTIARGDATRIVALCCTQVFLGQQAFLLSGIYKSACQNPRFGFLTCVDSIGVLFVSVACLLAGGSPIDYAWALAGEKALFLTLLWWDSRHVMPTATLRLRGVAWRLVRPYVMPGLGHAGMPFINAFHNHGVLLAIGAISGTENVAIFQAARVLINGVKSLMGLTSAAIGVEISAMLLPRMKDRVWQLLVRNVQFHILVVVLACLSVLPIGEGLFRLWLGGAAHYEGGLMALLLASLFPFALSNTIVMFLAASNVVHRIVLPLLAVALGMIALVAIGVSYAGVTGVGVGVLCGEVAVAAVVWRFAWGYAGLTRVDVLRTFCDWSAIRQDVSVAGDRLRQGLSRGFKSH